MAVVAIVLLLVSASRQANCKEICRTKSCEETAARVMQSINVTSAPCDDFYEFACRGWITKHPVPKHMLFFDPMNAIQNDVDKNLQKILLAPHKKGDRKPIKQAREFYRTCLDKQGTAKLLRQPYDDKLRKIGFQPAPPTDREAEDLDISKIVGKARRYFDIHIFIRTDIDYNPRDRNRNEMQIRQTPPPFNNGEVYKQDPSQFLNNRANFLNNMESLMIYYGGGHDTKTYVKALEDFMAKLSKILIIPNPSNGFKRRIDLMTFEQIQRFAKSNSNAWNWTTYFNSVFEQTDVVVNPKSDTAILLDIDYFPALMNVLSETSKGTIARYVWWQVLTLQPYLNLLNFHKFTSDNAQTSVFVAASDSAQNNFCTRLVTNYFGMALTAAYVQKHFTAEQKKRATEMWTDVRESFDEMLTELNWMDPGTKLEAHKKLTAMRPFIGFPEWVNNPKKLEAYYEEFEVLPGRLLETCRRLMSIVVGRTLNNWKQKPDINRWILSGTTVNAFYTWSQNAVVIPAAILHPPLYGNGVEALNYGAIGALLGHELTHGFDNQGREYDASGTARNWWSDGTAQHFTAKINCLIKQYSGYVVTQLGPEFKVNGVLTRDENIADNGGIREAFRAYQKFKTRSSPQKSLPGLAKYTDEQLFFLGFAQTWCGKENDEYLKKFIRQDPHAPFRFRVIGTLQNNAEFANAWRCPSGSPMNPKHKCIVW